MKIGIYTQPLRTNYGGILQAWALQMVLRRMGHEVVTFDPCPYLYLSWKRLPFSYTKRFFNKWFGSKIPIRYEKLKNVEYNIKSQHLRSFIEANIYRKEFRKVSELQQFGYDILIAGSDQVWRPRYNITYGRIIEYAFFDFAQTWNVKRIAYAASFGTDEWEFSTEQTARCSQLATRFSAISVREKSGVKLCKEHLGVEAKQVLDPTMLLNREDYEELIEKGVKSQAPSGEMLCYILDENSETDALIENVAGSKGFKPFRANFIKKNAKVEDQVQPSIEQWLRNFQEAKFVVTDSFHACVFSIIFGKPFVVITNVKRGVTRYESLLSMFNLSNHLIRSASEYQPNFDYAVTPEARKCLDVMKETSLQFLKNSLTQ